MSATVKVAWLASPEGAEYYGTGQKNTNHNL